MSTDFSGKRVLVTGSTQGIGYEIAKRFAAAGAEVFVHGSRDLAKAERAAKEIGAAHAVTADLADLAETASLFDKTGAVDILILNASVQYKEPWEKITDEHFAAQVDINLRATLKLMQAYFSAMKEKGWGRIVTIGSVNQHRQHPELSLYAATKSAVMSLVKNAAKTAAPYGVTINNVSPGVIPSPRNEEVLSDPAKCAAVEAQIPVGRFGTAEEIAHAVLFFCGEDAGYITGADLTIDGGMRL